jgi:hypothetical protein
MVLKSIFYAMKHPEMISAFPWNPEFIDGAKQYLLRKEIIRYPQGARCIRNAALCEGYVINEKYEIVKMC